MNSCLENETNPICPAEFGQAIESQCEVLKSVAEVSGDSLDEYIHSEIIQGLESDIDLYFGHSKTIKEKLFKKLELNKNKHQHMDR